VAELAQRNGNGTVATRVVSEDPIELVLSSDVNADVTSESVVAETPPPVEEPPSLTLIANDDSWVALRMGGRTIAEKTMRRGDSVSTPLTARARVTLGRPWEVRAIVNGKDIGIVWTSDTVKKVQSYYFDPDGKYGLVR
jgi:hypothetical protein